MSIAEVDRIVKLFESLIARVDALEERIEARLDELNADKANAKELDNLERTVSALERKVDYDKADSRDVTSLERQVSTLETTVQRLEYR